MKSLPELLSLKGKCAIVTGAATGIGRAISARLAEAGANLILLDIDPKGLSQARADLTSPGSSVLAFKVDLSAKGNIDRFWSEIRGDQVDILVNNAGVYPFKRFLDLEPDYLDQVMQVNLYSVLWMCQSMIKRRGKRGGIIVNIGSIEAIMPFKDDLLQYSVSKVGVITLTRDLAREFGKDGFRVNAVLPGGVLSTGTKSAAKKVITDFQFGLISDAYNFMQRLPLRRLGTPDEIARIVLMLSSDFSTYVHGALIPVDGGFLSS
jgi:NAD(P)-dependent dehydrogenase (short-subunit alcohol dehydrogenase family)